MVTSSPPEEEEGVEQEGVELFPLGEGGEVEDDGEAGGPGLS